MNKNVYAIGACRTAIGNFGGALKNVSAVELGATVMKEAVGRAGVTPEEIEEVTMGCVLQAGLGQNVARQAAIKAGIPVTTPAQTINKVCGSGIRSVILAAQSILCGDVACAMGGGTESMSNAPFLSKAHRWGARMGNDTLVDSMINEGLWEAFNNYHMGVTAENVTEQYGISRAQQDTFAYQSQMKAARAIHSGAFAKEIVPVAIPQKKADPVMFDTDEFVRGDTTEEKLNKLRPAFKPDGTVTAGNSSGINDGAAAVVLADEAFVEAKGIKPLFRIVSWGSVGVDPSVMGMGPVPSIRKALGKASLRMEEISVIELNEAFAAQSLAVMKELDLNQALVNPNGGAIALGHPIGASGTRILVTLYYEMLRRNLQYGLASLCIGGGMGEALIIERDALCR